MSRMTAPAEGDIPADSRQPLPPLTTSGSCPNLYHVLAAIPKLLTPGWT
jgi:hypothetical protein